MTIAEMLRARKVELEAQKAAILKDLEDVEVALAAILKSGDVAAKAHAASVPSKPPAASYAGGNMPIDEAIIIAVRNRARTPAKILVYLKNDLGINTTINSVRTRVSRLKKDGKLVSTALGWMVPTEGAPQMQPLFEGVTG